MKSVALIKWFKQFNQVHTMALSLNISKWN